MTVAVIQGGKPTEAVCTYDEDRQVFVVELKDVPVGEEVLVDFGEKLKSAKNQISKKAYEFLDQAEIEFMQKESLYSLITQSKNPLILLGQLKAMKLEEDLLGALMEIITA